MQNQQLSKLTESSSLAIRKNISDSSDEEIKQVLRYVMNLVGVAPAKVPQDEAKAIMIAYIKSNWANQNLNEIKEAFDSAAENLFIDLNLYDRPFNIVYLKSVIAAYRVFKAKNVKPAEGMTNNQRAMCIYDIIKDKDPDLYDKLKSIGKEKPLPPIEINQGTQLAKGVFGEYEKEFDELVKDLKDMRFVEYKGKYRSFHEYCNFRFEEDNYGDENNPNI